MSEMLAFGCPPLSVVQLLVGVQQARTAFQVVESGVHPAIMAFPLPGARGVAAGRPSCTTHISPTHPHTLSCCSAMQEAWHRQPHAAAPSC